MDPKELALEHFEKALLGIALVVLAIIGIGFGGTPKELNNKRLKISQLTQKINRISSYMSSTQVEAPPPPDLAKQIKSRLDPSEVEAANAFPKWVMHRRPHFFYWVAAAAKKHEVIHESPVDFTGDDKTRGKVELSWKPSDENRLVVIKKYLLQRREGKKGKWQTIQDLEPTESPSYIDRKIVSRIEYYYQVISVAEVDQESPVVRDEELTLEEGKERRTSVVVGPFSTKRDVFLMPTQVSIGQRAALEFYGTKPPKPLTSYPKVGKATIRVWKWDQVTGKFVEHTFRNVKEGEEIGGMVKNKRVKGEKGRRAIDFSTGATLKFVTKKKRKQKSGKTEYTVELDVIEYQFKDGTKEAANQKDRPPELKQK